VIPFRDILAHTCTAADSDSWLTLLFGRHSYAWPQVLDLGVTQMMSRRLMRIFPYMCAGSTPQGGSVLAIVRATRRRLEHLGRRSQAHAVSPG